MFGLTYRIRSPTDPAMGRRASRIRWMNRVVVRTTRIVLVRIGFYLVTRTQTTKNDRPRH
jgi:hypothetical protein